MQGYKRTGAIYWDRDLPPENWQPLFANPLSPTEEEAAGVVGNETSILSGIFCWEQMVQLHGFTPGKVVGLTIKN